MKKRLPLFIAFGIGALIWKTGAFGFMASERTITFRFPVSYGDVRKVELQVWDGESLLSQQERTVQGLQSEPELKISMSSGPHRAIGRVSLEGEPEPRVFQRDFDPGSEDQLVLEMRSGEPTQGGSERAGEMKQP